MKLKNYSLKIKNKTLLGNVSVEFKKGYINHILGKNGVGKSTFAKDLLNHYEVSIIGSYSNLPLNWRLRDLINILKQKYNSQYVEELLNKLNCHEIETKLLIKNLSDGQKQKLKIVTFLLESKDIIIFDELTNALDKKTINDIYQFINNFDKAKTIINITHNISDLKSIPGKYFYIEDKNIIEVPNSEKIIKMYIEG